MSTFKNFMALATLVLLTAVFGAATASAQSTPNNPKNVSTPSDTTVVGVKLTVVGPGKGQQASDTLKLDRSRMTARVNEGKIVVFRRL